MFKNIRVNAWVMIALILSTLVCSVVSPESQVLIRGSLVLTMVCLIFLIIQLGTNERLNNQETLAFDQSLKKVVVDYNDLHQQASLVVTEQFTLLKKAITQIANITNSAAQKLSNSLIGLQSESDDQRELLQGLVAELEQVVSNDTQEQQIMGMNEFSDDTRKVFNHYCFTLICI